MSRKLFGRGSMVPRVGHLVGYVAGGNHGCTDGFVGEIVEVREDMVVVRVQNGTVTNCHSCWQVGHDSEHTIVVEGELVGFTTSGLVPNDGEYTRDILWTSRYVRYYV